MSATLAPNDPSTAAAEQRPLRIQEAAELVGLTPRAIRHYEAMGLLRPGRSDGAYRLYEPADVERLRTIRALRDDAGFSVADIAELLDDDEHRQQATARWQATDAPDEQRRIALDRLARLDRRLALLDGKIARLTAMADEARGRRTRVLDAIAQLDVDE